MPLPSSEIKWFPAQAFVIGLEAMQCHQPPKAIRNVQTELDSICIEEHVIPLTRNLHEYNNSYVCSPYTAYIRYARDELGLIDNQALRLGLRALITLASGLLRLGQINQTLSINNWLFSTNIVPNWQAESVRQFTQQLASKNPTHSLSIRSLNQETNAELMQILTANGWQLLPARQVYLFLQGGQAWWKKNNVQNDQRLLRKTEFTLIQPIEHNSPDFEAIETCFNQLFIEKHSTLNPQFSAEYFEFLHNHKLVEFFSFRNAEGRIIASIGLFTQHGLITAPILGYDTDLPQKLGLYRLLIAVLLKETHHRQQSLNLSSGAGDFKRQRGGKPVVEYTALYTNHLPWLTRIILKSFSKLLNKFAPEFLQKHQL
jgi:hypothetical protein